MALTLQWVPWGGLQATERSQTNEEAEKEQILRLPGRKLPSNLCFLTLSSKETSQHLIIFPKILAKPAIANRRGIYPPSVHLRFDRKARTEIETKALQ